MLYNIAMYDEDFRTEEDRKFDKMIERLGYISEEEEFEQEEKRWQKEIDRANDSQWRLPGLSLPQLQNQIDGFINDEIAKNAEKKKSVNIIAIMKACDFQKEIASIRQKVGFKNHNKFAEKVDSASEAYAEIARLTGKKLDFPNDIELIDEVSNLIRQMCQKMLLHEGWENLILEYLATNIIPKHPVIKPKDFRNIRIKEATYNSLTIQIRTKTTLSESSAFEELKKLLSGRIFAIDYSDYGLCRDELGFRFALYKFGYLGKKGGSTYGDIAYNFYPEKMKRRNSDKDGECKNRRDAIRNRIKRDCKKWENEILEIEKKINDGSNKKKIIHRYTINGQTVEEIEF